MLYAHTSAYVAAARESAGDIHRRRVQLRCVSTRQHTSGYDGIRQREYAAAAREGAGDIRVTLGAEGLRHW